MPPPDVTASRPSILIIRKSSSSDIESDLFCGWRDSGCLSQAAASAGIATGQDDKGILEGSVQFPSGLALDWGRTNNESLDLVVYLNTSNVLVRGGLIYII